MLEEQLTQIFYKASELHGDKKPNSKKDSLKLQEELKPIVDLLAEAMRQMKLTIIPSNLLPEKSTDYV